MVAENHRDWEDLSELDPMWAVLSEPQHRFGKWDPAEFFSTGEGEVAGLRSRLSGHGLPDTFASALDFGCGLGRITRALRICCTEVIGVDVSEGMIRQAQSFAPDCQFIHNPYDDLRMFPSNRFDLLYSCRVLQHQPSKRLILEWVSEFVRVVKPGGAAAFQVPSYIPYLHRIQPRRRLYRVLQALGLPPRILHGVRLTPICITSASVTEVTAAVELAGGTIVAVGPDDSCPGVESKFYLVTK